MNLHSFLNDDNDDDDNDDNENVHILELHAEYRDDQLHHCSTQCGCRS